jgi:hypothetical protein
VTTLRLVFMKGILYVHARLQPLAVALSQALVGFLSRRLLPAARRRFPTARAGRILVVLMWLLGLVCQAIMVWLLVELVDLAIGLFELWAVMAGRFVEL